MTNLDTLVVGLGVTGSALLERLSRDGQAVMGIDRFVPPHRFGSSHSHTRAIRRAYFEDPRYVPLLNRAYELWAQWAPSSAEPLIRQTGGLMIGNAANAIVSGSLHCARTHGLAHELLSAAEIRRRFPALQPTSDMVGLFEPDAGLISPEQVVPLLLGRASNQGADVQTNCQLTSWEWDQGSWNIMTTTGPLRCRSLVLCTGGWSNQIISKELPCVPYRVVQFWFEHHHGKNHQHPAFPLNIWDLPNARVLYAFPDIDGYGVKAGYHEYRQAADMETLNRGVSDEEIAGMQAEVQNIMPSLGPVVKTQVCIYATTPDRHFIVGPHPRFGSLFLALRFSGHGFKFAPVVAEELGRQILGVKANPLFDLFSPSRFL